MFSRVVGLVEKRVFGAISITGNKYCSSVNIKWPGTATLDIVLTDLAHLVDQAQNTGTIGTSFAKAGI